VEGRVFEAVQTILGHLQAALEALLKAFQELVTVIKLVRKSVRTYAPF